MAIFLRFGLGQGGLGLMVFGLGRCWGFEKLRS